MITTIIAASVSTVCIVTAIRSAWINRDLKDELKYARQRAEMHKQAAHRAGNEAYIRIRQVHELNATIETLKEALRDKTEEETTFGISRLVFDALKPDGTTHHTDFKLGLGPCGKTVEWLTWEQHGDRMHLTQYHTDGSLKVFKFHREDIVGREVEQMEELKLRKGSRAYRDLKGYVNTQGGGYEKGMSFKEWQAGNRQVIRNIW